MTVLQKYLEHLTRDPLSQNAIILLSTWCMNAAVGFIFILIAAKIYTIDAVGIATLLIAYSNIVVLITRFGVEQSMIRFYDKNEKSAIYCSTALATTIPAICFSVFLVLFSYLGLLGSDVISTYSVVFIVGVVLLSISEVNGFFFLASGKPKLYLFQNIIIAVRLLFLVLFISFGVLGLFSSLVIAVGISVIFSLIVIHHSGVEILLTGKKFLKKTLHFSLGNYISDIFQTAPIYILPIMVFFLFGQKETAIYSVGYAIASIAFLIPASVGYASFISGCQENPKFIPRKWIIIPTLFLLGGLIGIFFFWGKEIISILGPDYSGTADLIVAIMCSSVFALFYYILSAEFKIRCQIMKLILINCVFFTVLLSMGFLFMVAIGLNGAGFAWIVAYAVCSLFLGGYVLIKKIISNIINRVSD